MTQYSYNGWLASPNPKDFGGLDNRTVGGTQFKLAPGLRAGDVATVLFYVAEQLNARVEPISEYAAGDDWGYNFRPNTNNPSQLSCHASGTAFDYNATQHPNGRKDTWEPWQQVEIKKILAEVNDVVCILWHVDEMHFEICADEYAVRAAAAKISKPSSPPPVVVSPPPVQVTLPTLKVGDTGPKVRALQKFLNAMFPAYSKIDLVPQRYGPQTTAVVKEFQRRAGVTGSDADGTIVGPRTNAALARYGYRG